MSDKLNFLYGYSKLKEQIDAINWGVSQYADADLKIVYELGEPQKPGQQNNVRIFSVKNGVGTVKDVIGYSINEQTGKFVCIEEEVGETERPAALALSGFDVRDINESDRFSDRFGDEDPSNSGVLSAKECKAVILHAVDKADKVMEVVNESSAEELITFANERGKDCR